MGKVEEKSAKLSIHDFVNKRSRFRWSAFWSAAGILAVSILSYMAWSVWIEYKTAIIDIQKEQLLVIAESLADTLENEIEGYVGDMNRLEMIYTYSQEYTDSSVSLTVSFYDEFYEAYVQDQNNFACNLVLLNEEDQVIWRRKELLYEENYGICSLEEENMYLMECRASDGETYFVLVKKMADGKKLQLVIDIKQYYQKLISEIKLGNNGYVVVKNSSGVIFMHPNEQQWGIDVISGRNEMYEGVDLSSLEAMVEKQNRGETGVSEYYSYWWMDPGLPRVKKISAYTPVWLGNDFLVVSAVMDYDEIYNPIAEGYVKIVLIFMGMLFVTAGMLAAMTYLSRQKIKNQEEISYLKELNAILEETQRSEETVAHQQRLQIMGTMTGGIAHEFNNLLTPIMGYADILLDMLEPESEEYDYAQEIFDASDKAKEVIRQISGLSRKNLETVYRFIPVKKMLARAMKMIRSVCPVNVQLQLHEDFGEAGVLGNETQLNQVLLNLSVNAFHAMGKKENGILGIEGSIVPVDEIRDSHSAVSEMVWDRYIQIVVSDNGCGMNEETMEQIFNPFFTTKVGGQGTGLGLSLVEQIIHSHKGHIFVESQVGEGSRFTIYLPVTEKREAEEPEWEKEGSNRNLRFLVLDDNGKVVKLLEKGLKRLEVQVDGVESTKEAKQLLAQKTYDVLLIDQTLSRTGKEDSGICFAMAMNEQYPDVMKIIMTDQVRREILEAKSRGWIQDYVEKPVSPQKIIEVIKKTDHP